MTTATSAALKARQLKVDQNAFDTNEFIIRCVSFLLLLAWGPQG